MHNQSLDLSVKEISKIEGSAGMEVKVRNGKVEDLKLRLSDYKRFYTQAIRGKPALGAPQLLARICGTCSNAHLMCAIEAVEKRAWHYPERADTVDAPAGDKWPDDPGPWVASLCFFYA